MFPLGSYFSQRHHCPSLPMWSKDFLTDWSSNVGKCVEKLLLFRKFKATAAGIRRGLPYDSFLAVLSMRTHVHRCQLTPWKNPNEARASWVQPETVSLFAGRTSIAGGSRLAHNPVGAMDLNEAMGARLSMARFITSRPCSRWKIEIQ